MNFVQIYGLFDKISILLNDYLEFDSNKPNYRTIWLKDRNNWRFSAHNKLVPKLRNQIVHDYVKVFLKGTGSAEYREGILFISLDDLFKKTESLLFRAHDVMLYFILFFHAEESIYRKDL